MKQFINLCFLIVLGSCSSNVKVKHLPNPKPIQFEQKYTLKQTGRFEIKLDSLTAQIYTSIYTYYDKQTGQNLFYFFNPNTYHLYFYDFKTKKLTFKVALEREGADGVGNNVRGYQVKNLDSIFVYNYPVQISIVNQKGKKLRSYKVFDYNERDKLVKSGVFFTSVIDIESFSPIFFQDSHLIMSGHTGGETDKENTQNRPFITILDLKSGKVSYGSSYTEAYQEGNWGGLYLRSIYSAYNSAQNLTVYSLPIEHNLYTTQDGIRLEKHYTGSKYVDNISSIDKSKDFTNFNKDMFLEYKFYAERPSYGMIIYDPYQEMYYRFVELPVQNFQKNDPPIKAIKKVSIIILDKNFRYLGEMLMPHFVYRYKSFMVTPEGLCFWRTAENTEDKAVFDIFNPKKITQ